MYIDIYMYGLIFLIGLIFGSFYNVIALRTLSGEKLSFPPSHCTSCNHRLGLLDLFPVFSYLFLGGKCRYCKTKISPIYPIGELLTAVSYTLIVSQLGLTFSALIQIVFITIMIIATVTDMKETIVPNGLIIVGMILVLSLRIIDNTNLIYYLASSAISFTLLFVVMLLSGRNIENEDGEKEKVYGMGGADVKLYALIGLAIGLSDAIGSLFYAAIVALIFQIPIIIMNKGVDRSKEIPFVPFITMGVLCTYLFNFFGFIAI